MYQMAAGAVLMGVGHLIGLNSAKKRRENLKRLADTPGVNFGDVYRDVFGAAQANVGAAGNLQREYNTRNAQSFRASLDEFMPGWSGMQDARVKAATSATRGELPDDVRKAIFRSSAGRSLGGGFAGSGAGRNLTARDLGRTSLDLMNLGQQWSSSINTTTPMPKFVQMQDLLNIDALSGLNTRSNERTQRLQMMGAAINAPTGSDIWSKHLQDVGGSLMGMGGMGGGGGGGGGGMGMMSGSGAGASSMMSAVSAFCWVAREVYGRDNSRWLLFRDYVINDAPDWFFDLYRKYGEQFANWIHDKPRLKRWIRNLMDSKLRKTGRI